MIPFRIWIKSLYLLLFEKDIVIYKLFLAKKISKMN